MLSPSDDMLSPSDDMLSPSGDILDQSIERNLTPQPKVRSRANMSSLNDLEFTYAPVRDQTRDLLEYL